MHYTNFASKIYLKSNVQLQMYQTCCTYSYFQFPWILDMEPYTAEGMARIEEAEELTSLSKPSSSPLPPSPSPVPPSPRADSSSGEPSFSFRNSLEVTTSAALPTNSNQINYELVGIVVHSGQANAGHYYSFIKDRR